MTTSALFQAAAEIFHADPRVRAMPYSEHEDMYVYTHSHYVEEFEEAPADFKDASLSQFQPGGFIAFFPETTTFLEGPVVIRWNADGTRTDYFRFGGEENARALTAHEAMQYAAYQSKVRSPAQAVAA